MSSNKYYIMHRKGKFFPYKYTSNQCKIDGHSEYFYDIALVLSGLTKLDKNDFIIDHWDIDNTIQELYIKGSCEKMCQQIETAVQSLFSSNGIKILSLKITIKPDTESLAFMEYITGKDKYIKHLIS